MSLPEDSRRDEASTRITDRAEVLSRYKRLRAAGRKLNSKLTDRLTKDVLHEGGRKLGILQGGTLVFNSEDETWVLMDYCIYDVRRQGRNAVEQYLVDFAPDPASDEMVCLQAMRGAIYSLFLVESVIPGFGVTVRDVVSNKTILIVDVGFGDTGQPGIIFASRLVFHEGFAMTTGAALPISLLPKDQQQPVISMLVKGVIPDDKGDLIRLHLFEPACGKAVRPRLNTNGRRDNSLQDNEQQDASVLSAGMPPVLAEAARSSRIAASSVPEFGLGNRDGRIRIGIICGFCYSSKFTRRGWGVSQPFFFFRLITIDSTAFGGVSGE